MKSTRSRGNYAEDYACKLLQHKGYKVLDRNFSSRFGEIDIIALDPQKTLVFVEVKARWNQKFGKPEEAVTPQKLQKIIKTSEYYCLTHKNSPKKKEIVVISLLIVGNNVVNSKIINVI